MPGIVIAAIDALQIFDSRGYPTLQVTLLLKGGARIIASAPSGASTAAHEAVERRDGGSRYSGKGVSEAIAGITGPIAALLISRPWDSLDELDHGLIELDGTPDKSGLGANALVAVSMAAARAFARTRRMALHEWIAARLGTGERLPVPHFNVINGGAHAANALDFQEFMIAPVGAPTMSDAIRCGTEVYQALARELRGLGLSTGLGDEGGFAPALSQPEEALDLLLTAIAAAGYTAGLDRDVAIAIDPAANGFYDGSRYRIAGGSCTGPELIARYEALLDRYPIRSIEDGMAEGDEEGWRELGRRLSPRVQLVGDDLLVTSSERIRRAAEAGTVTAALIKPNQIGTVSETFSALTTARELGLGAMISHRSGETNDTFVSDLAVGSGVGQLKSGAPARGERVAKYNRLLEIEHLGELRYGLPPEPDRPAQTRLELSHG